MYVDDLCKLEDLTDENVLECLRRRYMAKNIYTNSGIVLISINPYTTLDLYGSNVMQAYFNTTVVDPHVYSVAETCYQDMLCGEDQTIVISGESGSGKTENTKYIIEYLMARTATIGNLKHKIEASNVILECFGNATTALNKNSSRVGRKISFVFDKKISGAQIKTYLLEKSRVTHQSNNEKNFHIFYQLLAYKGIEISNDFINTTSTICIKKNCDSDSPIINRSEKIECKCDTGIASPENDKNDLIISEDNSDVNLNKENYLKVLEAFKKIGLSNYKFVENTLLGIIYLGSVCFKTTDKNLEIIDIDILETVSKYLEINSELLRNVLIKHTMTVGGETIELSNTIEDAITIRNSIARDIYSNLFDYIVNVINENFNTVAQSNTKQIAILDIFGFEIFEKNSLDQLCINWTNEKIQNEFLKRIFMEKKKDYELEGLSIDDLPFEDNSACIEEIEKSCGLLDLIDEESNNSWGSPENLEEKIKQYVNKYITVKYKNSITVQHYAGKVTYDLSDFLEKNRERSALDLVQLGSTNKSKRSSAIRSFSASLNQLFESINKTQIKYIRCIRPNEDMRPLDFNSDFVYKQLVATGVTETIKISRQLFSHEMDKNIFYKKFPFVEISKLGCIEGNTKIFMSSKVRRGLESARELIRRREYNAILEIFVRAHNIVQHEKNKKSNKIQFTASQSQKDLQAKFVQDTLFGVNNLAQEEINKLKRQSFIIEIPKEIEKKIANGDFNTTDLSSLVEKAKLTTKEDKKKSPEHKNKKLTACQLEKSLEFTKRKEIKSEDKEDEFIERSKHIEDPYERIKVLEDKLIEYKMHLSKPCTHCNKLELKYKFQSEALKSSNLLLLELEKYKMRISELENQLNLPDEDDCNIPPSSNLFGCVISLFLEYVPSFSNDSIPRSEILSLAHASFKVTMKINKNLEESVSSFIDEMSLRLSLFERNIHKLIFVLSNLIEYQAILRSYIESPDLDDLIEVLFKHMCELQKSTIFELLPYCITEHQQLKNFRCSESYLKKIFKPPSITKLVSFMEYFYYQMQFYHLPEQFINESLNYLLKSTNVSVFNSLLIKKNFLSFNRCVQINYNLNEIDKFCRSINYYEGMLNMGHSVAIIKLVNLASARASADCILDQCSILNCMQITELINKLDEPVDYYFGEDNKNEKFLPDPQVSIPTSKRDEELNFVCPRYVPYDGLSSIFKFIK